MGPPKLIHATSCLEQSYRTAFNGQFLRLAETAKKKSRSWGALRLFVPTDIKHKGFSSEYCTRKEILASAGAELLGQIKRTVTKGEMGKEKDSPYVKSLLSNYSLEMTAKDVPALEAASRLIPQGATVNVTFLPNENMAARVTAAAAVRRLGFVPMPHLSARRLRSKDELTGFLARLSAEAAVDRAFVIAGDPESPEGPYEDSLALIRSGLLQANGIRCVGISGYPEGHPQISEAKLWQALKDKVADLRSLGLDCVIVTQFGFDSDPVLEWLARLRSEGVSAPVRVGLPGPASVSTLLRFAARCGVMTSAKVMSRYGLSMTKLIGSTGPDRLVDALLERLSPSVHGDVYAHFYPFGGLARAAEWANNYRGLAQERLESAAS